MNLQDVIDQLRRDERNKDYTERGIGPIFQIHEEAKILIIGQAPGRKVEESGIPFHDKSGETLMDWMGIDASVFYSKAVSIMPMDFTTPVRPRPAINRRAIHCHRIPSGYPSLMPDVSLTILIGKYAMDYYLKGRKGRNLTETVHNFAAYLPDYFPIVHPSPLNFRWQAPIPGLKPTSFRCCSKRLPRFWRKEEFL